MLRHFVSRAGDYSWINFGADYERTCPFNVVKRDRTFRVQLPRTQNPANTTTKLFGNSASENVSRGADVTCVGSRESTNELNTRGGWMQMGQRGKNILIETRWTTMSLKKEIRNQRLNQIWLPWIERQQKIAAVSYGCDMRTDLTCEGNGCCCYQEDEEGKTSVAVGNTTIGAIASCKLKLCSVSFNIIPLAAKRTEPRARAHLHSTSPSHSPRPSS